MYKIFGGVIKFIEDTMKNWRVDLTAGGKSLTKGKMQRDIFQGDSLSPSLFVIAMIPLNHMIRKCTGGYKLTRKNQQPNVRGRHKTVCQKWKIIGNPKPNSEEINKRHWDGIWHYKKWAMLIMKSGKRQMTEGMELLNKKIRTLREKENYK